MLCQTPYLPQGRFSHRTNSILRGGDAEGYQWWWHGSEISVFKVRSGVWFYRLALLCFLPAHLSFDLRCLRFVFPAFFPSHGTEPLTNVSLWLGVESVCSRRDGRNTRRTGACDEERVSAPGADQRKLVQLLQLASSTSSTRRPLFLAGLLVAFSIRSATALSCTHVSPLC